MSPVQMESKSAFEGVLLQLWLPAKLEMVLDLGEIAPSVGVRIVEYRKRGHGKQMRVVASFGGFQRLMGECRQRRAGNGWDQPSDWSTTAKACDERIAAMLAKVSR